MYIHLIFVYFICHFFALSQAEKHRIAWLTQFITHLYGWEWCSTFWYDVQQYRQYDLVAANEALISIQHHLWDLTLELIVFASFDDKVSNDVKRMMAATLNQTVQTLMYDCRKKSTIIQSHICTPCSTEASACEFYLIILIAEEILPCACNTLSSPWSPQQDLQS